ncbi:MAG: DUF3021 domain-containing protein [Clostridia bacterium]|nr:DUF3021 domain-containing protein [Clostridia bacterium]
MKKLLNAAWSGIVLSAVVFVVACMLIGLKHGEAKFADGIGMARICAAVLVIGLGFGIPSMIYGTELPTGLKVLIHMGTGTIIMLAASIWVGWIDFSRGWLPCLLIAAFQIAVAFILWLLTCVQTKKDAKEMNEVIEKKD